MGDIGFASASGVDKKYKTNENEVYLLNYMDVYKKQKITEKNYKKLMVTTASNEQIKTKNIIKGDIFFTPSSETKEDIGHSLCIAETLVNAVYSYHLYRFRPSAEKIDISFSNYFTNTPAVRNQLIFRCQGNQRFVFSINDLINTNVRIPSLKEQSLVGYIFNYFDSLITLHQRKLDKLNINYFDNNIYLIGFKIFKIKMEVKLV
ncbi:restriction endonuclease subunit S [Metamycoplasma canadense]|uniref:Type I restriction modification system specificity (S) subunit, HsdS n=1 Tax=Metamycoplasma canadense TaxID=29554 RepID=A0A077LAU9_9BACT|nr:restriction endonuclease subunit S [Metamycoplasma canadense]BAP39329.1 type I restriction modification system specificity (S) subunit, HsdS [Metamycoplasma canadense]